MKTINKLDSYIMRIEKVFSGSVWLFLFSVSILIMLWLGFLFNISIPGAAVQVYLGVLGSFAVHRSIREYTNNTNKKENNNGNGK